MFLGQICWYINGTPLQYSCLENPMDRGACRLQSMGPLRVGHNWATSLSLFTFMHWRRKWQPTPVFLPGDSQGRGSLVGCRLWGRTESVGHDWSDLAAVAVMNICVHIQNNFFSFPRTSMCDFSVWGLIDKLENVSSFSIF